MDTELGKWDGKNASKCGCPSVPVRLSGYSDIESEPWFIEELAEAFEDHFGYPFEVNYNVLVPARIAYSFFSVFPVDLALILMGYGFSTVTEAEKFLSWNGFGYLHSYGDKAGAQFACHHGIDTDDYLDIIYSKKNGTKLGSVMDALFFLTNCDSTRNRMRIANGIASGEVNPNHLEEIGMDLIKECVDVESLYNALKETNSVSGQWEGIGLTSADVKGLLAKCSNRQEMVRRLKLLEDYNLKTALDVVHHGFISNCAVGPRYGNKYTAEHVIYADNLFGAVKAEGGEGVTVQDKINAVLIKALSDSNVDITFAAPLVIKGETPDRIVAMHAGVHTSMTDGWL